VVIFCLQTGSHFLILHQAAITFTRENHRIGGIKMSQGDWLASHVKAWQIGLSPQQQEQFSQYYRLMMETNQVINLTTITAEHEVYVKHFYDSLTLAKAVQIDQIDSMIDVGTGAGFPGIPLKIVFPHVKEKWFYSILCKKELAFCKRS
jgi:hypothetical protein